MLLSAHVEIVVVYRMQNFFYDLHEIVTDNMTKTNIFHGVWLFVLLNISCLRQTSKMQNMSWIQMPEEISLPNPNLKFE